ncbi:MAG: helix-turn-helix domain-containing protein [Leptothrix sp. (in: b-proteobacteria)]
MRPLHETSVQEHTAMHNVPPKQVLGSSASTFLTIEDAASMLGLSRPHVFKLIDERCFSHVLWQDSKVPLIPLSEISRFRQETVM